MARIFLSYASEQRSLADTIQLSLGSRGHSVFFDRDDLPGGSTFEDQIEAGLNKSSIFIFLISPQSIAEGRFTLTELKLARSKWPSPNGRILPVMVVPTPMNDVPPYLKAVSILEPSGSISAEVATTIDSMLRALKRRRNFRIGAAVSATSVLIAGIGFGYPSVMDALNRGQTNRAAGTGSSSDLPVSAVTSDCFDPTLFDAIRSGNVEREAALAIGTSCAAIFLPGGPGNTQENGGREKFIESFVSAATSDDQMVREAAASVTLNDGEGAIQAFIALAEAQSEPLEKAKFYRSAATLALTSNIELAMTAFEQVVANEPGDLSALAYLAGLYASAGRHEESERAHSQILSASGGESSDLLAGAKLQESMRLFAIGNVSKAHQTVQEGRKLYENLANRWGVAQSLNVEADFFRLEGNFVEAAQLADSALLIAENHNFPDVKSGSFILQGQVAMARNDLAKAQTLFEEAEALAKGLGNKQSTLFIQSQLGLVALGMQDWQTAETIFEELRVKNEELEFEEGVAWAEFYLGQVAGYSNQPEKARELFQSALDRFKKLGLPGPQVNTMLSLAQFHSLTGNHPKARQLLDECLGISRDAKLTAVEAQTLWASAFQFRSLGKLAEAERDLNLAVPLFRSNNNLLGALWTLENLGQIAEARNDLNAARTYWSDALQISRSEGVTDATQRLEYELNRIAE